MRFPFFRILRAPEAGEPSGGASANPGADGEAAAAAAQPTADNQDGNDSNSEPAAAPSAGTSTSKEERLYTLREKMTRDSGYEPNDEESALLDEYEAGTLKPAKKAQAKPASKPQTDPDDGDEDGEAQPGAKPADDKAKGNEATDPDIQGAMQEVGAKTPAELRAKIKDLRKLATGKDAQRVSTLEGEVRGLQTREQGHLRALVALKNGDPAGLQYLTSMGIDLSKFTQPGAAKSAQGGGEPGAGASGTFQDIPLEEFLNPAVGKQVNSTFRALQAKITQMEQAVETVKADAAKGTRQSDALAHQANVTAARKDVAMSAARLAEKYPELKPSSGNIFDLLDAYWNAPDGAATDPRIQLLVDVIEEARQFKLPDMNKALEAAARFKLYENLPAREAAAAARARNELTKHTPSVGMSDLKLHQKDAAQNLSDQRIDSIIMGLEDAPPEWLDEEGDLDDTKIPARVQQRRLALSESRR